MFTYRSAEGGCKTSMTWPFREGLCRLAHEDMNPVPGWNDHKHF